MNAANNQPVIGEVCIPNIGPKERQKRLIGGAMSFITGVALFVAIQAFSLPLWANLFTLPLFFFAGIGFFQWNDKTCIKLVREGVMNLDDGDKPVTDAEIKAALQHQAKQVQIKSLIAGVLCHADLLSPVSDQKRITLERRNVETCFAFFALRSSFLDELARAHLPFSKRC